MFKLLFEDFPFLHKKAFAFCDIVVINYIHSRPTRPAAEPHLVPKIIIMSEI